MRKETVKMPVNRFRAEDIEAVKPYGPMLLILTCLLLLGLRGQPPRTQNFDVNSLYGLSQSRVEKLMSTVSDDSPVPSTGDSLGTWSKGDLFLSVVYSGSAKKVALVECCDYQAAHHYTRAGLLKEFNVKLADPRYKTTFGQPDEDGSVHVIHLSPRH